MTLSRRTFLEAGGALAVLLGLGGGVRLLKRDDSLLRPPGGQDEARLMERCLKCDRCRSICPTSVIAVAHLEDGVLNARTPKLNFKLGYCTFCQKCVEACPTAALGSFSANKVVFKGETLYRPDAASIGLAVVDKDRCIAYQGDTCTLCSGECPFDAISVDEHDWPMVDAEKCNGCGRCEYVCPSSQLLSYAGGTKRGIEVHLRQGREGLL